MGELFRTFDTEVVQTGGAIAFRKRLQGGFAVVGFSIASALLLHAIGGYCLQQPPPWGPIGSLLRGVSGLLGLLAALGLLGTLAFAIAPSLRTYCTIDSLARSLRFRKRTIPFSEIVSFNVAPFGARFLAVVAATTSGESLLVLTGPASRRSSLEALARTLTESVQGRSAGAAAAPSALPATATHRFRAAVALVMGVLWTAGGYFFFPNLSFVDAFDSKAAFHVPVWSAGFIMLAIGLYYLWAARRAKRAA